MSSDSHSTLDLRVEDFERLGVRPDEIRLTVIRRAATKTSRALAENQLTQPSDTAALQLSRVTTSAYRLLDPRNRGDVHQRIHVGRILPTVLMWAGQTKFQNQHEGGRKSSLANLGISEATISGGSDASMPFQGGGLSEADLIELMELDSTPLLAGQPIWTQCLSDVDILGRSHWLKRWNRCKRALLKRWYSIGLAVVLLILFVGALAFPERDESIVMEEVDPAALVDSGVRNFQKRPSVSSSSSPVTGTNITAGDAVDRGQELKRSDQADLRLTDDAESDGQGSQSEPIVSLDTIPEIIFEIENPVAKLEPSSRLSEKRDDMVPTADRELPIRETSGFLPDPFSSSAEGTTAESLGSGSTSGSDSDSIASQSVPEKDGMTVKQDVDPVSGSGAEEGMGITKRVVPESSAVADARASILALESVSFASGNADNLAKRIVSLQQAREPLRLASAEYWAVSVLLMESVWQTSGTSDLRRILIDLQHHYEFAPASLLVETYVAANVRSALPEIQQELLANGLVLLDQLVVSAQFELAEQIFASVEPLALALQDSDAIEYLLGYARAIGQASRQRERFESLLASNPDTWSRSNRGLLGRYYCLILRRWSEGLPWLCSASDSRIASAAKSELALPVNSGCEELVAIARRWNLNAKRASGLAADAMHLHAVSSFRKAMNKASERQRLEFGAELREMSETLPDHLHEADLMLVSMAP